jgi:autotransporter-associated beta strand protein
LTKTGAGTLTLGGTHTYRGDTTVSDGTLELARGGSLASDHLSVAANAAFTLRGAAKKNVTIASGGTLNVYPGSALGGALDAVNARLNFHLSGDTALTVFGEAKVGGCTLNVDIAGSAKPLDVGDTVVLIDADTLTGTPKNDTANGVGMGKQGIVLKYEFRISTDDSAQPKRLLATVTQVGAREENKSPGAAFPDRENSTSFRMEACFPGSAAILASCGLEGKRSRREVPR